MSVEKRKLPPKWKDVNELKKSEDDEKTELY